MEFIPKYKYCQLCKTDFPTVETVQQHKMYDITNRKKEKTRNKSWHVTDMETEMSRLNKYTLFGTVNRIRCLIVYVGGRIPSRGKKTDCLKYPVGEMGSAGHRREDAK